MVDTHDTKKFLLYRFELEATCTTYPPSFLPKIIIEDLGVTGGLIVPSLLPLSTARPTAKACE